MVLLWGSTTTITITTTTATAILTLQHPGTVPGAHSAQTGLQVDDVMLMCIGDLPLGVGRQLLELAGRGAASRQNR